MIGQDALVSDGQSATSGERSITENGFVDGDAWVNIGDAPEVLEVWQEALGVDCGDLELAECKLTYEANYLANIAQGDEETKARMLAALTATREYLGDSDVSGYSGDYTDVIGSALGVEDYLSYLSGPVEYNNEIQGETYFVNEMVDNSVQYLFFGDERNNELDPKLSGGVYPSYKFTYVTVHGKTRPVTLYTNNGVPCDFNLCADKDQTN
ncbi:hypothetical protein FM104_09405 [Microbacterium esteraromaticum]|uniref:Uncharacterized protein n=1 Tax=Microbacterium esteraromaticum TaxID=57043 RepID=A0A1R4JY78_9MICO|nr:hypothetical protein FM104_09405 [Microbacterium esteraromaticum]